MRDLRSNKSHVVNVDLKAFDLENLRLDVTSSLGMHIFSLVQKNDMVEYIVVPQKKHFTGPSTPQALSPVFPTAVNPRNLAYIFFEKPIPDKNWSCDTSSNGETLSTCKNLKTKVSVKWEMNKDGTRLIRIVSPGVSVVQINIRDFSKDLKDRESTLTLKVPKSFTSQKI